MIKKHLFFCLLLGLALCQYPGIFPKNPFPHNIVLKGSYPSLDVQLDYYFDGFNLSYSLSSPAYTKTLLTTLPYSNQNVSIQQIHFTSVVIDGNYPAFAVLKENNGIDLILRDYKIKSFSTLPTPEAGITCFGLLVGQSGKSLYVGCHNRTAQDNLLYRLRLEDAQIVETMHLFENFKEYSETTQRELKFGYTDSTLTARFHVFSVNRQSKEWVIQELLQSEGANRTWYGSRLSSGYSPNNTLENLFVTKFIAFPRYLVLYDENEKELVNYDKTDILSSISLYESVRASGNNASKLDLHSMSGGVRFIDSQEQILLNIGDTVYHVIIQNGSLVERQSYKAVNCDKVINSGWSYNEIAIIGTRGYQNRIVIYKVDKVYNPVYFMEDSRNAPGAKFIFSAYGFSQFVRVDQKDISSITRGASAFTIDKAWAKGNTDFNLTITSQNRFVKEVSSSYPEIVTQKVHFKVIQRKDNDFTVELLPRDMNNVLIQHPGDHTIDLEKLFHGPSLSYSVTGIPDYQLKSAVDLNTTAGHGWTRTMVSKGYYNDVLLFQEMHIYAGTKTRVYRGENINGKQFNVSLLAEFELASPITVTNTKNYPDVLMISGSNRLSNSDGPKMHYLNLHSGTHGFGSVTELPSASLKNCSQIHFSEDPMHVENIYCLDVDNQVLYIYQFDKSSATLKLIQTSKGPSFLGNNTYLNSVTGIFTHSELPDVLIFKYGANSSTLAFHSWLFGYVVSTLFIKADDYFVQSGKLLAVSYARNTIEITDLSYVRRIHKRKRYDVLDIDVGIVGKYSRTLDLFGCTLLRGATFSPSNSDHFYIKAKCPDSNSSQILVYSLRSEYYESLITAYDIPGAANNYSQVSVAGGLYDSTWDQYDLLSVNVAGQIYYHAIYYYPHIKFDSKLLKSSMKEKVNIFHIDIAAKGKHSQNSAVSSLVLSIAKFQDEIRKKTNDHSNLLPITNHINEHKSDTKTCFTFDPTHFWTGSILEIEHHIDLPRSLKNDSALEWEIFGKYKLYNRFHEIERFQQSEAWGLKISKTKIYFLGSSDITVANISEPEKPLHILPFKDGASMATLHQIHLCPKEDCIVGLGVGRRNRLTMKGFTISPTFTLASAGEVGYSHPPTAFSISEDGLVFAVFDYDPQYWLSETFISVFDVKNLQRNWTFAFSHIDFMTEAGEAIGFHYILAVHKKQGEYVVFISTNATGLMSCQITVSPSATGYNNITCHEYNLNHMIRYDLLNDDPPVWSHVKLVDHIKLPHKLDQSSSYTLLLTGLNTPIYIVDVSIGDAISIIQGFVNYHQTGTQVDVVVNENYVVSYIKPHTAPSGDYMTMSYFSNDYIYVYELTNTNAIKVNAEDSWTLEEALTRVHTSYDGIHSVAALQIHPTRNTVYILDGINSEVSIHQIEKNSTMCFSGNRTPSTNTEYNLVISASNDLGSENYTWHIEKTGESKPIEDVTKVEEERPEEPKGGRSILSILLILLAVFVIVLVFICIRQSIKLRAKKAQLLKQQQESVAELPDAGSSYKSLQDS